MQKHLTSLFFICRLYALSSLLILSQPLIASYTEAYPYYALIRKTHERELSQHDDPLVKAFLQMTPENFTKDNGWLIASFSEDHMRGVGIAFRLVPATMDQPTPIFYNHKALTLFLVGNGFLHYFIGIYDKTSDSYTSLITYKPSKRNILHEHQAFPFPPKKRPLLQDEGAYMQKHEFLL